ncbi:MAG TPA: hypothetical protein VGT03_08485 [Candidatus Acidoferrales bacterium]|nr:hypothetical protein [Candidatus Acidoferrales bacterium]
MFERLKRTLVESYVGAIALGYLLAQVILHFVEIFAYPVAVWVSRNYYQSIIQRTTPSAGLSFQDALPELERFVVLLLVWYLLLRWLYLKPLKKETSVPPPNPEQPV